LAVEVLGKQGVCALLGVPGIGARFDVPCYLLNIGRTVCGVVSGHADPHTFLPKLLELYKRGHMPIEKFITRYPFEQINTAADDLMQGRSVKPVLIFENE